MPAESDPSGRIYVRSAEGERSVSADAVALVVQLVVSNSQAGEQLSVPPSYPRSVHDFSSKFPESHCSPISFIPLPQTASCTVAETTPVLLALASSKGEKIKNSRKVKNKICIFARFIHEASLMALYGTRTSYFLLIAILNLKNFLNIFTRMKRPINANTAYDHGALRSMRESAR